MATTVFDNILHEREIKNEKRVAIVRFILGAIGIQEILSYFGIINIGQETTLPTLVNSGFLFVYALIVIIIVYKSSYLKYLKFFVIFFDYLYVVMSFLFDPTITAVESVIIWYAFAAAVMFYLINLLRYSTRGTIFAGVLSVIVFGGISAYYSIPPTTIFSVSIALALILGIGYIISTSNKKMMVEANTKRMMERYLPPQLVGELYNKNTTLEPGGKSQEATILFSDIKSFTTISESMSAAEVVSLLNNYLSDMTDIIFANQGTIDKFIGDAIMTIFGAPVQQDDDVNRAVQTAIEMNKALILFNKKYELTDDPLQVGIGIHTGEVIAGNIGSDKRLDYTVIGDNVNLSSRIQGLCNFYKCPILISEATYRQLSSDKNQEDYCIREVDNVIVKGRSKGVKIYEVLYYHDALNKEDAVKVKHVFDKGLALYRQQNFQEAFPYFEQLESDDLSKIYMARCRKFIENPPAASWDGTFTMISK